MSELFVATGTVELNGGVVFLLIVTQYWLQRSAAVKIDPTTTLTAVRRPSRIAKPAEVDLVVVAQDRHGVGVEIAEHNFDPAAGDLALRGPLALKVR